MHIAVDFDRTLAEYYGGKNAIYSVGKPIPEMVEKVKVWLSMGHKISIFTARVAPVGKYGDRSQDFLENQKWMIEDFLVKAGLPVFPITAIKYPHFDVIVDDKAVRVEENTGQFSTYFPYELSK